jgi:hypothetical protein
LGDYFLSTKTKIALIIALVTLGLGQLLHLKGVYANIFLFLFIILPALFLFGLWVDSRLGIRLKLCGVAPGAIVILFTLAHKFFDWSVEISFNVDPWPWGVIGGLFLCIAGLWFVVASPSKNKE